MVKRFLFALIALTALAGCATTLGAAADSWIGAPVNEFVDRAGIPIRSVALPDGRVAYTWETPCELTLVTQDGIIKNWSSRNCVSIHPLVGNWKRQ